MQSVYGLQILMAPQMLPVTLILLQQAIVTSNILDDEVFCMISVHMLLFRLVH